MLEPKSLSEAIGILADMAQFAQTGIDEFGDSYDPSVFVRKTGELARIMTDLHAEQLTQWENNCKMARIIGKNDVMSPIKREFPELPAFALNTYAGDASAERVATELKRQHKQAQRMIDAMKLNARELYNLIRGIRIAVKAMLNVQCTHAQREGQIILVAEQVIDIENKADAMATHTAKFDLDEIPF